MRQILFKAKRLDNGEWAEGYLFDDGMPKPKRYFIGGIIIKPYEGTACDKWNVVGIDFCEIDPDTLCQYTGLTDKNGKRIWENDIVRFQFDNDDCPFPNKDTKKRLGKIFFSDFRVSWSIAMGRKGDKTINNDLFKYVQNGNRVEVIGNIFDNAELLEVE